MFIYLLFLLASTYNLPRKLLQAYSWGPTIAPCRPASMSQDTGYN